MLSSPVISRAACWLLLSAAACRPASAVAPSDPIVPIAAAELVAEAPKLDPEGLTELIETAREERSAALLVWVDGELLVEESFGSGPRSGLFGPLDIAGAYWMKDGRGDPRASGELVIRPTTCSRSGSWSWIAGFMRRAPALGGLDRSTTVGPIRLREEDKA